MINPSFPRSTYVCQSVSSYQDLTPYQQFCLQKKKKNSLVSCFSYSTVITDTASAPMWAGKVSGQLSASPALPSCSLTENSEHRSPHPGCSRMHLSHEGLFVVQEMTGALLNTVCSYLKCVVSPVALFMLKPVSPGIIWWFPRRCPPWPHTP